MPAELRLCSGVELARLVEVAGQRGFSRTAKGLSPQSRDTYGLFAYLYEASPEAAWICLVIRMGDGEERPEFEFGRLDVALADFNSLRRAEHAQRDQLLHWMAWLASHRRDGDD